MHTACTFSVTTFEATEVTVSPPIETALPIGVATMEKAYRGGLDGRSATIFTSAYDAETGTGTYVAMEAFEGAVDGRTGTFAYVHGASTSGADRAEEFLRVVPGSATGDLAGLRGHGRLEIDADGTHRLDLEYELTAE